MHAEKLAEFSKEHLEIIIGCLHIDLKEEHTSTWIEIFNKLKKYVFLALLEREMCSLASSIIKRLFFFSPIQPTLMQDSHMLFLRLINFTYDPDIDGYCKENLLDLFESLNSHATQFKTYTYNLIKEFSEQNKDKFLKSNLVDFMNTLARERRTEVFQETASSFWKGDSSSHLNETLTFHTGGGGGIMKSFLYQNLKQGHVMHWGQYGFCEREVKNRLFLWEIGLVAYVLKPFSDMFFVASVVARAAHDDAPFEDLAKEKV